MPRSGCEALHGVNPNLKKNVDMELYHFFWSCDLTIMTKSVLKVLASIVTASQGLPDLPKYSVHSYCLHEVIQILQNHFIF